MSPWRSLLCFAPSGSFLFSASPDLTHMGRSGIHRGCQGDCVKGHTACGLCPPGACLCISWHLGGPGLHRFSHSPVASVSCAQWFPAMRRTRSLSVDLSLRPLLRGSWPSSLAFSKAFQQPLDVITVYSGCHSECPAGGLVRRKPHGQKATPVISTLPFSSLCTYVSNLMFPFSMASLGGTSFLEGASGANACHALCRVAQVAMLVPCLSWLHGGPAC